jgi:Mrp family chromosome partitioning ATPase
LNKHSALNLSEVAVLTTITAATPAPKHIAATSHPTVSDEIMRLASQLIAATPGESTLVAWTPVEANPTRWAADLAGALIHLRQGLVLLVDANFRRPTLHKQFGVDLQPGFAGMLCGKVTLTDALCPTSQPELTVLPAGAALSEASLLAPTETDRVFEELRPRFRYILVQTPAYFESVDAALLAARADGVVIAAQSGKTRKTQLREMKRELEAVKARLLGVALSHEVE